MSSSDVQENPHEPATAPRESMANAITVEAQPAPGVDAPAELEPAASASTLQENPHVSAAPRQSMLGAVTIEAESAPVAEAVDFAADVQSSVGGSSAARARAAAPALLVNAAPMPAQPRLRTSFYYDGAQLRCELALMTATREPVHRETFDVHPGSTFAQLHALLLTTATIRAQHTGRVAADAPSEVPRPNATDLVAFVPDEPEPEIRPQVETEPPPTTQREP